MAAPLSSSQPRRAVPLALKFASLPVLSMGSPVNEKDPLPCIMITPSTPTHDRDFEILYFTPAKPRSGFFGHIRDVFSLAPTHRIALPDSPDAFPYGQSTTPSKRWSVLKKFRAFLVLMAAIFVLVHLFVLPHEEDGLYVFQSHHRGTAQIYPSALVWEDWVETPATSEPAHAVSSVLQEAIASITSIAIGNPAASAVSEPVGVTP